MRILIVEDDFLSRRILKEMLSGYGVCDWAVNGEEAIAALRVPGTRVTPMSLLPWIFGCRVLMDIRC